MQKRAASSEAFKALFEVAMAASGVLKPAELAKLAVERTVELIGNQRLSCWLYWWQPAQGELVCLATSNDSAEKPIRPGEGVNGVCFEQGEALILDDYASWHLALPWAVDRGTKSCAGFPLKVGDQVVGVLGLRVMDQPIHFDEEIIQLASLMAGLVGPSIHSAELHARLEEASEELGRKNAELERASRLKSEFLANMSHELRTPLSAIIGFSELLLDGADGDLTPDQHEDIGQIQVSGRLLLQLINDILDLSKIEAGRMTLEMEPMQLDAVISQVVSALRPLALSKSLQLNSDVQAGQEMITADSTRIRQVLTNLVANALKFTSQGAVTIGCRKIGHELEVSVTDTGIGMAQDALAGIFEEFIQAEASTTRRYGGTGLGLAISKSLIEMQGGVIGVTSTLGEGSKFWFRLPCGVSKAMTMAASMDTEGAAQWISQTNDLILAVDDEESTRRVIVRRLKEAGFKAAEAGSAAEALHLARELHPVAITLDVMMPGTDGWAVLVALKAEPQTRDIPVVMVSIVDGKETAIELGAAGFLNKPFSRAELISSILAAVPSLVGADILCVDDEESARDLIERSLKESGASLRMARSAREAMKLIEARAPDAILCDLMMPEVSGFELVAWIRQQPHLDSIPVIVLSARELTDEDVASLGGRIERFIAKQDLRPTNLGATIRQAISYQRNRSSEPASAPTS